MTTLLRRAAPAPNPPGLQRRFASGFFWSLTGAVGAQGAGLLASIFVARMLGRAEFGAFGILHSTVMMFGLFSDFGQGLTATKYVAELRSTDPDRAGRIVALSDLVALGTGCVISLALVVAAPWLALHTLEAPELTNELRIAALVPLIAGMSSVQVGALSGMESFRAVAGANLLKGMISLPATVGLTWWLGLRGAVLGVVLTAVCGWLINRVVLRRECRRAGIITSYRSCGAERGVLWRFSLPALAAGLIAPPVIWFCNTLLVGLPDGYAQLGVLTAARQWQGVLTFLPQISATVTIPILASLGLTGPGGGQERSVEVSHFVLQSVVWAVALPMILFSRPILSAYGDGFSQGAMVLVLLAGGTAVGYLGSAMGSLIVAQGRMWLGAGQNAAWAGLVLLTTYLTVDRLGASGLALGFVVGYTLQLLTMAVYLMHRRSISRELGWRILASALAMLLVLAATGLAYRYEVGTPLLAAAVIPIGMAGYWGGTTVWARSRAWDMLGGIRRKVLP